MKGAKDARPAIPFADLMAFGLGVLRLAPDAFWAMSVPEMRAAIRGFRGETGAETPLDRAAFAGLMAAFPDT